jgi:hypothetical protein
MARLHFARGLDAPATGEHQPAGGEHT